MSLGTLCLLTPPHTVTSSSALTMLIVKGKRALQSGWYLWVMQRKTRSMMGWGFGRTNSSPAHYFCPLVPQSIQAVTNALLHLLYPCHPCHHDMEGLIFLHLYCRPLWCWGASHGISHESMLLLSLKEEPSVWASPELRSQRRRRRLGSWWRGDLSCSFGPTGSTPVLTTYCDSDSPSLL